MKEYTPDVITELPDNGIFVFGSNEGGFHGKGAALIALKKFGAKYLQARGLQGRSYAIVTKKNWRITKSSSLEEIKAEIKSFLYFAEYRPDLKFYVTKIGSSLGGYSISEIASLFKGFENYLDVLPNVILPKEYDPKSIELVEQSSNVG